MAMLLLTGSGLFGQDAADTAALLKEFNKVMSFTSSPYLHYTTVTRLSAAPVLETEDTAVLTGEFFKNNTELYSNNMREELYMQDSLMVQINNSRKTIWINRVDMESKAKMNIMPAGADAMLESLKRGYNITKSEVDENTSRLSFEQKRVPGLIQTTTTRIELDYNRKSFLPESIRIEIHLKQPVDDEILAALREQDADEKKLLQTVNGQQYVIRTQVMHIQFTGIDNDKKKVTAMPLYSACMQFDAGSQEYTGVGKYKDYEVTKLF